VVTQPSSIIRRTPQLQIGLAARLAVIGGILFGEKAFLNMFVDFGRTQRAEGFGATLRIAQHWGFRFCVAFAVALALFAYIGTGTASKTATASARLAPLRIGWIVCHLMLVAALAPLSYALYRYTGTDLSLAASAALGVVIALCAVAAALLAMAPAPMWIQAASGLRVTLWYAALAALIGTGAMRWSQMLWEPTAAVTFDLVKHLLNPLLPSLTANPDTMVLSTDRFSIQIAEVCSGLEGVGMMLAFSGAWLLYFRREYIFPRALLLVPVSLVIVFALNAFRIAALMLIGYSGYPDVAIYGFHSQAGWIAFLAVACGFVLWSRRSAWLNRTVADASEAAQTHNPTAVYLMPLLAILGAGAVSRAFSGSFEYFYPLRLVAGVWMFARYRGDLTALVWRCTWRGPAVGALVFLIWMVCAHYLLPAQAMPAKLAALPPVLRGLWILSRVAGAVVLVPFAEELAYRGYLMRRWFRAEFETLPFSSVRWPALLLTAIAFGLVHGQMWLPGITAGLAYGLVLIRRGDMGEAVAAHAVSNSLVVIAVLAAGQWQLW
jgi:exosortase E/protease (VPEID-CTERM system)